MLPKRMRVLPVVDLIAKSMLDEIATLLVQSRDKDRSVGDLGLADCTQLRRESANLALRGYQWFRDAVGLTSTARNGIEPVADTVLFTKSMLHDSTPLTRPWEIETSSCRPMNSQIVGNIGLYLVCFELSKRGWNVMPTARNAKGIDIIAYDLTATRYLGIQVKALSKKSPVPLGQTLDRIMGDFWIIANNLESAPGLFILTPSEARAGAHRGEKDGRVSFWLQPKSYMLPEFEARWDRLESAQSDTTLRRLVTAVVGSNSPRSSPKLPATETLAPS